MAYLEQARSRGGGGGGGAWGRGAPSFSCTLAAIEPQSEKATGSMYL